MSNTTDPLPLPELWRDLVTRLPVVVYVSDFDEHGTLRWISPAVERLLGHPAEAFLDDDELWYRCVHPDDLARVRAEERRVHRDRETFDLEYRMVAADGHVLHVWERDALVCDEHGRPIASQGAIVDVTAERVARGEAERAQTLLDLVGALVTEVDVDGRVLMVNRALCELLGRPESEIVGTDGVEALVAPEDRERAAANIADILEGTAEPQVELRAVDGQGARRDVLWSWTLRHDDTGAVTAIVASGLDLTERRMAEEQAAYLACHDPLTGLPNRALLDEHIEIALARARREGTGAALLVLDLVDFRLVNDELGVAGGDHVLQRVAARLGLRRRAEDVLARTGGDEFAVLLTGLSAEHGEEDVLAIAEDYLRTLAAPFAVGAELFDVEACAGCALYPADARDATELNRHASIALEAAKCDGRGSARRFHPSAAGHRRPLSLTARLRRAMERDELLLHWQPIVELPERLSGGAEGLVRWQTHDGLLPPGAFVPYAEESRLIEQLDDHVLELACREVARWDGIGDRYFGVNVSAHSFTSRGYADRVRTIVTGHGVDPERLVLELTESALMAPHGEAAATVAALRQIGLQVAIDDFGTGFSSLARIIELPVTVVKLDRSFLARGADDPATAALVASLVEMTQRLGRQALVEGVETAEQLALLEALAVPLAQGYHLGRPAPAEDVFPLLGGVARHAAA